MMSANERKREADRLYYAKNRLSRIESVKSWVEQNEEKVIAYRESNRQAKRAADREYYSENKGKRIKKTAEWSLKNRDYVLSKAADYRAKNKEEIKAYSLDYRKSNKEKFRIYGVKRRLAAVANVSIKEIPDDLLEAKLKLIEIHKFIKDYRNGVVNV